MAREKDCDCCTKQSDNKELSCGCHHSHEHHEHEEHHDEQCGLGDSISCNCGHDHGHGPEQDEEGGKTMVLRIMAAAVLLGINLVIKPGGVYALGIYAAAYLIIGYDIIVRAVKNLIKGNFLDENFLMSVASIGAMAIGEHAEGVAVMLFYQVGEYFQGLAVDNSRKQIKALLRIKPETANLKTSIGVAVVSPEKVNPGDVIIVKAGEKVPLDGVIITGTCSVDTSALTGESMPADAAVGDRVLSGSINLTGVIEVRVEKGYDQSTVFKILEMVEQASEKKAVTENFITKFAKIYTPTVVGLAALIAIVPSMLLNGGLTGEWVYKALVFLVVSCPCALVLSIPLTYFGGLGCASKHGILVKGGNYLEALANADVAVFDKTGTLTHGTFHLDEVVAQNGFEEADVLKIAAHAEHFSNHPIALSVAEAYRGIVDPKAISDYFEIAGMGVDMKYEGRQVYLGNLRLMAEKGIAAVDCQGKPGTVLYLGVGGVYAGCLVITDVIKENTAAAIKRLKENAISKTVMLTGDNEKTGQFVREKTGIDLAYCQLLPGDKVTKLEELFHKKEKSRKLLYVGDGINDSPVLMRADIGIAMGAAGSDAAIEAADVIIMNDDLEKVADSIVIARKTRQIVWQNIVFALGTKLLVMLLSVTVGVHMYVAIFADVGVAVLAVLNATRVLNFKVKR